jgi:chromosome segregation ATPase
MSLLSILIVCGLVAALAFFLAGYLLRSPRAVGGDLDKEIQLREALTGELEQLRQDHKNSEVGLAEAKEESRAATGGRQREEEKRVQAERERDSARAEAERLSAQERIANERLRIAEDQNRAAFEREEKQAEGWGAQLQASKAEQKRQEQAIRAELEQLRADAGNLGAERARQAAELDRLRTEAGPQNAERARLLEERAKHEAERARLIEACAQHQALADEALRALDDLQARILQQTQFVDGERAHHQSALSAAEERERELLQRLAETETSGHGKAAVVEEALRAMQVAAQVERHQLAEQLQRAEAASQSERDEKHNLATRMLALEEALAHEREQGRTAREAVRAAETRLAELDRLAQENSELRAQQADAAREAKWQAGRGDEVKDAKVELAAAQAKLAELGRTLEENRRLRDEAAELRQHQEASGDLERLTAAHKQLRLDAELMARRLQELMQDRTELVSLRTQAAEAASLVEEVAYLRRREKDLEAQLYASGMSACSEIPASSGEKLVQTPVSTMETNLHSLVGAGGPRTAVLADAQGFLIAGAGESGEQEGLAAFAAVAGEMVSRARMLLPLAEVDSLRVTDRNSMVLTCHLFESAGEGLGVTTLGPGEPEAGNTARAIVELAAIVSGVAPGADPEPDPAA